MKTNLEEISSIKKKLSIEIDSEEVDKKLNDAYGRLAKNAKIPGFRPGKIPRKPHHFLRFPAMALNRSVSSFVISMSNTSPITCVQP